MYNSIVGHACSAWVSLTSLHTTTGVDPVRETTCVPQKDGGIALMPCPKTQQTNMPACSPHYPFSAQRQTGSSEYHFLKSFGMNRLRK